MPIRSSISARVTRTTVVVGAGVVVGAVVVVAASVVVVGGGIVGVGAVVTAAAVGVGVVGTVSSTTPAPQADNTKLRTAAENTKRGITHLQGPPSTPVRTRCRGERLKKQPKLQHR
jgi:hypothetical protein